MGNAPLDDIPIQAGDETGVGNVSQLISITEESEPTGGGSTTETPLGMRNNLVRSSKEILKTHKVPFPGFKKKDKDKEKEKDKSVSSMSCMREFENKNQAIQFFNLIKKFEFKKKKKN